MSKPSFAELRARMIDEQLLPRGICDQRVLRAMAEVPRERFMPDDVRDLAYDDYAHAIAAGQTISQPYTVAFMCEAAQLQGEEKVLEVGTGSGYGAAVLSRLARRVVTIERIPELADEAQRRLAVEGFRNVTVVAGDGTQGVPAEAPFDAIVVTAGGEHLPPAYVEQLNLGGRIIMPIGGYEGQTMYRFTLEAAGLRTESLGRFAFVPLVGDLGEGSAAAP
jgi:protein-L-isoaspartate(D-aspartate) O-methyltransferase